MLDIKVETIFEMSSYFTDLQPEPPNAVLGLSQECLNDKFPNKINLTIGVYRTENGDNFVLPSVRSAEAAIFAQNLDHEYLPQDGLSVFNDCTQRLLFGDDASVISNNKICTMQTVAGTGALRIGTEFLKRVSPQSICAIPNITWQNHPNILNSLRVPTSKYRYLTEDGCNLDFDGMMSDLAILPAGSIVLLHSCAHNPSGCDPTNEQWCAILELMQEKRLFPFFDNAYQGFVSGNPDEDAYSIRLFAERGFEMVVACSFSKNFGLYGERVGALHIVTSTSEYVPKIQSVLRSIARYLYSTCPTHGSRIVSYILSNPDLCSQWKNECNSMATRLNSIRRKLFAALTDRNVKGSWKHIIMQRGMFSLTGIPSSAVLQLKEIHHVYMLSDGRISLAGLNDSNIHRFVDALVNVLGTN